VSVSVVRRKSFNVLEDAADFGPYDELPVIPARIDPQLFVSRNDRAQPFFYAGSFDMLLTTVKGSGRVEYQNTSVLRHQLGVGDFVNIPALTPHRVVPDDELLMIRYKSRTPGREAVIWYCEQCSTECWRHEYDADVEVPQGQWVRACERFNADPGLRTCPACGAVVAVIDLEGLRWGEIADALEQERSEQATKETS
jgi:hypothetical protein